MWLYFLIYMLFIANIILFGTIKTKIDSNPSKMGIYYDLGIGISVFGATVVILIMQ